MQKILVTDTNVVIRLAVMFMNQKSLDLNNLNQSIIYVPKVVHDELRGLILNHNIKERIGTELQWLIDNITPLSVLPEPDEEEVEFEHGYYSDIFDLLLSKDPGQFSDSPSKADIKIFLIAKNNSAILVSHEQTLVFLGSQYYKPENTLRFSDLLIKLYRDGDITVEQIIAGNRLLVAKKEFLRREDRQKLNKFLKEFGESI